MDWPTYIFSLSVLEPSDWLTLAGIARAVPDVNRGSLDAVVQAAILSAHGNSGAIVPIREGRQANTNAYCREYQQTVYIGGRQEQAVGQACQNPDGTWEIIN